MREGLEALTKFVKVVMSYRPDRKNQAKTIKKQRAAANHERRTKKSVTEE